MTTLPRLEREIVRARQEAVYQDPAEWWESTPVAASSRLRCVLRYLTILERYDIPQRTTGLQGGFRLLEPGCGVGSLSSLLAMFAEVTSFDLSAEAIHRARTMFSHLPSVTFFQSDGTQPDKIAQLNNAPFDVVLIKEFVPLARNIAGNPTALEMVQRYYRRLRPGGVLIIEHALPPGAWGRNEAVLQTSQIIQAFHGQIFNTLALDVAHLLVPGLKGRFNRVVSACARALGPLAVVYCLLRRVNLSKTLVIRKPHVS